MSFKLKELMFNLEEAEDTEHVALKLKGCAEETQKPVLAEKVIACGGRTDPKLVPGSVRLDSLEDLKSALREMETQIREQLKDEKPLK